MSGGPSAGEVEAREALMFGRLGRMVDLIKYYYYYYCYYYYYYYYFYYCYYYY